MSGFELVAFGYEVGGVLRAINVGRQHYAHLCVVPLPVSALAD